MSWSRGYNTETRDYFRLYMPRLLADSGARRIKLERR